jgi:hypothetical protein
MSDNLSDLPSEFSDAGPEARSRSVSQPDLREAAARRPTNKTPRPTKKPKAMQHETTAAKPLVQRINYPPNAGVKPRREAASA